jgi:hypothetical protein
MDIGQALELYILSEYEEEPFPFEWSDQDLYEQIRKLVMEYNDGMLVIPPIPSKYRRLKRRYEEIQKHFIRLAELYFERCGELPQEFAWMDPAADTDIYIEGSEYEF